MSTTPEQTGEPFLIRGHHMMNLQIALHYPAEHERQNNGFVEDMDRIRRASWLVSHLARDMGGRKWYADDTTGENGVGNEAIQTGVRTFAQTFLALPDDAPVKIGASKDLICSGCFIGEHCERSDRQAVEDVWLKRFHSSAEALGLQADVTHVYDGQIDNVPDRRAHHLVTTAATARAVIGDRNFALDEHTRNQKDLDKRVRFYGRILGFFMVGSAFLGVAGTVETVQAAQESDLSIFKLGAAALFDIATPLSGYVAYASWTPFSFNRRRRQAYQRRLPPQ